MGGTGYGDRAARGQSKVAFPASEKTSQEAWDAAFSDYDADTYLARAERAEEQARQDKVARLAAEAASDEKLNQERLARSQAEKAAEPVETANEQEEFRFGSVYTDSQKDRVSSSSSREVGSNS
jgi:hypothetical protein